MDGFLARRAVDPRFQNERRVTGVASSGVNWYNAAPEPPRGLLLSHHTFATKTDSDYKASESKGDSSPKKSRKLKRKKGSDEFTEAQKKELRNRESSDGSDSGGCWSGYESVEGKKKGEKGSCRKK